LESFSSSSSSFVLDELAFFCSEKSPIVPQLFCSVILIVNEFASSLASIVQSTSSTLKRRWSLRSHLRVEVDLAEALDQSV
jgi:hypothetical protein